MGEREITARSDVYALGAVTYEMLTGEPPFTGPTAQAIVAKVVTEEPRPLIPKRRTIPAHVQQAVLTALEKLPADRFESAAQFADALNTPGAAAASGVSQSHTAPVAVAGRVTRSRIVAASVVAALLVLAFLGGRSSAPASHAAKPVARYVVTTGTEHRWTGAGAVGVTISGDGNTLVYLGQNARGLQLYRRRTDELVPMPIAGTEGAFFPTLSPDGQALLYFQGSTLRRMPIGGGAPTIVTMGTLVATVPRWLDNEVIVVGAIDGALYTVGGTREPVRFAGPDSALGEAGLVPLDVLPGGRNVLALAYPGAAVAGRMYAIDVQSGERRPVLEEVVAGAAYDPSGYLVWVLPDGSLFGAPFDARRMALTGSPVPLAQGVRISVGGPPQFAASRSGDLVYVPEVPFELHLVTREGAAVAATSVARRFHSPRISPDGRRIAVDFTQQGSRDIWTLDLQQGTLSRLSFENDGHDPVWFPDSRRVAYASARGGTIGMFARRADGSGVAESLYVGRTAETVGAFTPDGRSAIVITTGNAGSFDLSLMPLTGELRPEPVLATPFNEYYPALSPDGQWLAYASDESGQAEVYVRPFPGPGARTLVSQNGGIEPMWSRNGRELFYRGFGERGAPLMAVTVQTSPEFHVVSRTELFDVSDYEAAVPHSNYDVGPDGRFALVYQGKTSELVLIQNWPEEVRRRRAGSGR